MEGHVAGSGGGELVSELSRVQELVRQLEALLRAPSSSVELCRHLAAQIIALTDRSIGMVRSAAAAHSPDASAPAPPLSGTPSPLSDVSDQPFRTTAKKRKATAARWTRQVRVSAAGGAEGPGDDGRSWRKYGQKDILGAKHPRGYYRCTHRNSQGCMATKQVQRSDHDAALFDVVYHGDHTCRPAASASARRPAAPPPPPPHNPHAQSLLQNLTAGLTVNMDGCHNAAAASTPSPLVSPSLVSPVASDSNGGLAVSACPALGYGEWHASDGDLQEVMSALAAVSAAPAAMPAIDAGFMQYCFDFDPNFDVDAPASFFP